MIITRKQYVIGASVVYLLALTGLAGYALHSTNAYSLPIPNVLCALTIALPTLAGVALETVISLNERLAARGQLQASRIFQVVVAFFLVFESVLATLAGTHYSPPGSLNCALRERWEKLNSERHDKSIRRIQDTFSCCGFNSPRDMAWPRPDATHGADACMVRYERDQRCLEPWRDEERKVAIMLLVVPVAVFIWKVAILLAPSSKSSWLPSHIRLPSDTSGSGQATPAAGRRTRGAIEYRRDLEGQTGSARREDSLQREVTNLNNDSQLATEVETQRTKTKGLLNESNLWREGRPEA